MNIQPLLEKSSRGHSHLCPRQILGVRIGLAGACSLNLEPNRADKRLLIVSETDGCFADGLSAATGCAVGHRTLRVEDYGKVAATFVDVKTARAVRVAPVLDIRQRAYAYAPNESRHYFAQMQAYQIMPADEMFFAQMQAYQIMPDHELLTITEVQLAAPIEAIVSRPGLRVDCDVCGEEIMNEREIQQDGLILCRACAHGGYYRPVERDIISFYAQQEAAL
ncbi:MAG: TraR/DksA C4-type zinc finger protein [Chloroflexi bacterium]|nr:TraR/DksA C4-type zinc finger protein [Chloroflexota bacterium]